MLSQHFCDRLDAAWEAAEESAAFFCRPGWDEGRDWEAAPSLAQLGIRDLPRVPSDEARSAGVPVRPGHIMQWRAAAEALVTQADDLVVFAAFAGLEDTLEPLQALVMRLLTEVESQCDLASGK